MIQRLEASRCNIKQCSKTWLALVAGSAEREVLFGGVPWRALGPMRLVEREVFEFYFDSNSVG